jgi:hypothetical protein
VKIQHPDEKKLKIFSPSTYIDAKKGQKRNLWMKNIKIYFV